MESDIAAERVSVVPAVAELPSGWVVRQSPDGAVRMRRTGWGRLQGTAGCLPYLVIFISFVGGPLLILLGGALRLVTIHTAGPLLAGFVFGGPLLLLAYVLVWVFLGQEEVIVRPAGVEYRKSLLGGGKRYVWKSPGEVQIRTFLTTPRRHRADVITQVILQGREGAQTMDSRARAMTDDEFLDRFQRPHDHPEMEKLATYLADVTGWRLAPAKVAPSAVSEAPV
ncbi:MAG: hypothetical protein OHK0029_10250 [Armatimonadaceae bacterium]